MSQSVIQSNFAELKELEELLFADDDYKQLGSTGGSDKNDCPIMPEVFEMDFEEKADVIPMDLDQSANFEQGCEMQDMDLVFEEEYRENSFDLFEERNL